MLPLKLLGSLDPRGVLAEWVLAKLWEHGASAAIEILKDAKGYVTRVGDLIVWQGGSGRRVLAGLTAVTESQARIEGAVSHLATAQTAMAGTLGIVQAVSLVTFGVTAFSSAFMTWRLKALNDRLTKVSEQIRDLNVKVDATHAAEVAAAVRFFSLFEQGRDPDDLEKALEKSTQACALFGRLASVEATDGPRRLDVLNYRTRFYVLSLMLELQCLVLRSHLDQAVNRIAEEQSVHMKAIAAGTFQQTIGKQPELYLDPQLKESGVTLELLTETYQQAHIAGVGDKEVRDASQMFEEHLRDGVFKLRQSWKLWKPGQKERMVRVQKLRYLLACLEDINRIEAFRLLIAVSREKGFSLPDLAKRISELRKPDVPTESHREKAEAEQSSPLLAYALA